MRKFILRNWGLLAIILITVLLIGINIHPNYTVIGLDNASPYFSTQIIFNRIRDTSSIIYGGIAFQLPFLFIAESLKISPALISNYYIFSNFFLGITGTYLLLKKIRNENGVALLGTLVLLASLFTFWIFSHPNFLFLAAYGSIPFLILLLAQSKKKPWHYLLLAFFTLIFLTTSLNIVAFFLYSIQILILVKILFPKTRWKTLGIWLILTVLFWFLTLQTIKLINGDTTFLVANIVNYVQSLVNNPYIPVITEDIIASEKTNTIFHTLSFSMGWTELHDIRNIPVFGHYHLYRQNILFLMMGIIPAILALATIFIDKTKKTYSLTILFILFILLSSRYGILLIERIPYIADALRWASSKFWPLYLFPLLILFTKTSKEIIKRTRASTQAFFFTLLVIILTIYSIPVLGGNLLSEKTLVNIPREYFTIPKNSSILILPQPQKLYMREYNWGYYGSDFISYINNSKIVDAANLYESASDYRKILESKSIPTEIHYLVYDNSVDTTREYNEILEKFNLIESNRYFDLYERK